MTKPNQSPEEPEFPVSEEGLREPGISTDPKPIDAALKDPEAALARALAESLPVCLIAPSQKSEHFDLLLLAEHKRVSVSYKDMFLRKSETMQLLADVASTHKICFRGLIECETIEEAVQKMGEIEDIATPLEAKKRVPNWANFYCEHCKEYARVIHYTLRKPSIYICSNCWTGYSEEGDAIGDVSSLKPVIDEIIASKRAAKEANTVAASSDGKRVYGPSGQGRIIPGLSDSLHKSGQRVKVNPGHK